MEVEERAGAVFCHLSERDAFWHRIVKYLLSLTGTEVSGILNAVTVELIVIAHFIVILLIKMLYNHLTKKRIISDHMHITGVWIEKLTAQ